MTSRGPYRRHSTPFKLQLCQDICAGVIGRCNAQRTHQLSANVIHLWLTQFDRGELTREEAEASVIAEFEAKIAGIDRKVGQLTMELDLTKKTLRAPDAPGSEITSTVTDLLTDPSGGGVQSHEPATQHLLQPHGILRDRTGVDDVTAPRRHRCAKVGLQ